MWAIPTGTSSDLKKKLGKESQYMVSHLGIGSDPPIGSDQESGRDSFGTPASATTLLSRGQACTYDQCYGTYT